MGIQARAAWLVCQEAASQISTSTGIDGVVCASPHAVTPSIVTALAGRPSTKRKNIGFACGERRRSSTPEQASALGSASSFLRLYMLNGLVLPIILFSILRLVNDKRLMGPHTNGRIFNILAYGLTILVRWLAINYLIIEGLSLFGIHLLE